MSARSARRQSVIIKAPNMAWLLLAWLPHAGAHVPSGAYRWLSAPQSMPRAPTALACDSLSALSLPHVPDPLLEPDGVVHVICRGLQHNDTPEPNAGLSRLYRFATYECRSALTRRENRLDDSDHQIFIRQSSGSHQVVIRRSSDRNHAGPRSRGARIGSTTPRSGSSTTPTRPR